MSAARLSSRNGGRRMEIACGKIGQSNSRTKLEGAGNESKLSESISTATSNNTTLAMNNSRRGEA